MVVIHHVKEWSPFSLDAVGLLTLLGVNTLQKALGRLVQHPWAECMPLLAGHIIPDDLILEPIPGFVLYNITDGIKVDGINAWFSRWILSQELSQNSTVINVDIVERKKRPQLQDFLSVGIGLVVHAFLIVFCVLTTDWYGLAAAISLSVSTFTRVYVLMLCRIAVDNLAGRAEKLSTLPVKVLMTLPNNKTVTVYTSRGIVIKCLVQATRPENERLYQVLRMLGWAGFGVFIITLGMSCLTVQIIVVVLMIGSSLVIIHSMGCDESSIGCTLQLKPHTMAGNESYMRTYAALQLTEKEEDAMVTWNRFPLRSNEKWWDNYHKFNKLYREDPSALERMGTNFGGRYS